MLRNVGDKYKVFSQGEWNPVCADPKGCETDECKQTIGCRPEEPGKLEVFVMSECPFGVKGLNAMEEVIANFKKHNAKFEFKINFIGDGTAKTGLTGMHGQSEVDENIRENCAQKILPKDFKYMDYILCRNKNIKGNWEACATKETGIDVATMKKCFDGEGKDMLEASYNYSKSLGIGGSPTWLANGKHKFSGIDPETIKTEFCKHNKLPGCDAKLSGQAPQAAGQPSPGCGG
jgi:hypothetical protein